MGVMRGSGKTRGAVRGADGEREEAVGIAAKSAAERHFFIVFPIVMQIRRLPRNRKKKNSYPSEDP